MQTGFAVGERQIRDPAEVARQHRGSTHERGGHRRGLGDGIGHEPAERALAQLAHEEAPQEVDLVVRGAVEHVAQDGLAAGGRSAAGRLLDPVERVVDVGDGQAGRGRRRDVQAEHGRPPDTDAALARFTGEEPDRRHDLGGREPTEQLGERRGLGGPGPRRRDRGRGGDDVGEQHGSGVVHELFEQCTRTGT